jgi:hypothetical protein
VKRDPRRRQTHSTTCVPRSALPHLVELSVPFVADDLPLVQRFEVLVEATLLVWR